MKFEQGVAILGAILLVLSLALTSAALANQPPNIVYQHHDFPNGSYSESEFITAWVWNWEATAATWLSLAFGLLVAAYVAWKMAE